MQRGLKKMMFSDFEREEMWALAQLLKRLGYETIKEHAEKESEAMLMQSAIFKLQRMLAGLGYDPR